MYQDFLRAGVLALFTSWLTVFPLSGGAGAVDMLWFLIPHTLCLLLIARHVDHRAFHQARLWGAFGCLIIGVVFVPLQQVLAGWMLAALGVLAAPVSVQMGVVIRAARQRTLTAGLGLAGGNVLVVLVGLIGLGGDLLFPLLSTALLTSLLLSGSGLRITSDPLTVLGKFLPFIFVFQVVSGLMYGSLMPGYAYHAVMPQVELTAYIMGALGAVWLFRHDPGMVLLVAVVGALAGFAQSLFVPDPAGVVIAMLLMLLAAGFMDLFILALVVSLPTQIRAYGYGVGVMCAGIVAGRFVTFLFGAQAEMVSFVVLLLLNIAVISLLIPRKTILVRTRQTKTAVPSELQALPGAALETQVLASLSDRERSVLELALTDMTYREIAAALQISESSVKTYMQRIFRKTGIFRRHQLAQLFEHEVAPSIDKHPPAR